MIDFVKKCFMCLIHFVMGPVLTDVVSKSFILHIYAYRCEDI